MQLEEEAGNIYNNIIDEDDLQIPRPGFEGAIVDIRKFVLDGSQIIWKKGYPDLVGKPSKFNKQKEFLEWENTKEAACRVVVRYFQQELLKKGAITEDQFPARFRKWLDTASEDCIFTPSQRRDFTRPHLHRCPWYIELKPGDRCPDHELETFAICKRETEEMKSKGLDLANADALLNLTEQQRKKMSKKLEREEQRAKAKAEKKEKERAESTRRKEEKLIFLTQAKKVKEMGLKKVAEDEGISPSGSSIPSDSIHGTSSLPSQSVYTIKTQDSAEDNAEILILNESATSILEEFLVESIAEEDKKPPLYSKILSFVQEHQGRKRRTYKGQETNECVDLIICDVPEGLPVPGFPPAKEVPIWNQLLITTDEDGNKEAKWIRHAFEFANEWLSDDGGFLVMYPDSEYITNEISAWAKWSNFKVEMKSIVTNNMPLTKPDFVGKYVEYFVMKLFVRQENREESIPDANFRYNPQSQLLDQGVDLINKGVVTNCISEESITKQRRSGIPWRGAREKSDNLLLALIDLCSEEEDIVVDLSASTGDISIPRR